MRKKDPQLIDLPALRSALVQAFELEPKKVRQSWLFSSFGRGKPSVEIPRAGFQETSDIDSETGIANNLLPYVEEMLRLLPEYYRAVHTGNTEKLKAIFDKGFPVNFINPVTQLTALLSLAGSHGKKGIKVLLEMDSVDYLIRDREGRLASEMAIMYSNDVDMAIILMEKEDAQGEREGIKVTRRPNK